MLLVTCCSLRMSGMVCIWAEDDTVYVAASSGVRAFDIRQPAHPGPLDDYPFSVPGRSVDVQVEDQYLYVAAENGGVSVFDVTQPRYPLSVGIIQTEFAEKIEISQGILCVADGDGGLVVVDATDPYNMRVVGYVDTPGHAFGVDLSGDYAYVADGSYGMHVVDLSVLTPTPTPTPTLTPTLTPTPTSTNTLVPTIPPTATSTATPTRMFNMFPLVFK